MSTNGCGLVLNAEARRGAARPSTETPRPPTSAISASPSGEIRPYADASAEQEGRGIIVEAVERHPRDRAILRARPFGQQGRLAVAGGRGHAHDAAVALACGPDQGSPTHGARPGARHRELGIEQRQTKLGGRGRQSFGFFDHRCGPPDLRPPSFSVEQLGVNIMRFA